MYVLPRPQERLSLLSFTQRSSYNTEYHTQNNWEQQQRVCIQQAHTTRHNVWLVSPCCMALSAALCSEVHVPRPARISFERRFEWADSTLLELFTLKVFSSPLSPPRPHTALRTGCDSSWLKRTWPALACLWLVYPAKPYPIWVVISKQTNHRGFSLWVFSALTNFISNV